jgi:hypothetical protein
MLKDFFCITDSLWNGDTLNILRVSEYLYERAASLSGEARERMLAAARAWKERAEEMRKG